MTLLRSSSGELDWSWSLRTIWLEVGKILSSTRNRFKKFDDEDLANNLRDHWDTDVKKSLEVDKQMNFWLIEIWLDKQTEVNLVEIVVDALKLLEQLPDWDLWLVNFSKFKFSLISASLPLALEGFGQKLDHL